MASVTLQPGQLVSRHSTSSITTCVTPAALTLLTDDRATVQMLGIARHFIPRREEETVATFTHVPPPRYSRSLLLPVTRSYLRVMGSHHAQSRRTRSHVRDGPNLIRDPHSNASQVLLLLRYQYVNMFFATGSS